MPTVNRSALVRHSPQAMFDLVNDFESYPEFLPWCAAARIRSREEHGDHEVMVADLVVSFKVFREQFGSRVTLYPQDWVIDTEYIDGPFRYMQSRWTFKEAEKGCEIHFHVDFEFKNRFMRSAAGMFFNEAMQRIVKAFEKRAHQLYG